MLDNLLSLVREHADDLIVKNDAVPNQHNNDAIATTAQTIIGGLQSAVGSGGLESVLGLLGGKQNIAGNPLVNTITSQLTQNLGSKFGVNSSAAGSIASALIPMVMSKLVTKTNDPNDSSFDLNGIFGQLTGGASQGTDFSSLLSGLGSGNQGGLGEIAQKIGQAASGNQQGGVGGMIGKLFGN